MAEQPLNFGHLIEGVVEQDPITDRYVIRTEDSKGKRSSFDIQEALAAFQGKEVRLTLASFENLERLAKMVEDQGGGEVMGIYPDDLRKSVS